MIDFQQKMLEELNKDYKFYLGEHHIELFLQKYKTPELTKDDVLNLLGDLLSRNLIYTNICNRMSNNWFYVLSPKGKISLNSGDYDPYNETSYITHLESEIPNISEDVLIYTKESIKSFNNQCYLASAVMIGVASECAFNEMLLNFSSWLKAGKEKTKFLGFQNNSRIMFINKFIDFRKSIQVRKTQLPKDLSDNMALTFDAILDLLRIYRNESGHPTGKFISHNSAFLNLNMFARYLQKLYLFRDFFYVNKE
ncbi:MAG: hypothetical protein KAS53_07635 [Candidatus Cloacimonetes bacterium]|nr:hypothetical protein [Candidatus Cloacimonadota bacterium]